ncbi:MAG: penicillin acylase family protein [Bryobacteraceae bacterium]
MMKRSDISSYNRAVTPSIPGLDPTPEPRARFSVLRAINLSIAVLLLALLIGAYWYVWRALPQTSGEISAPISTQASIVRDSLGVPHITAGSWQDAVFLQGYATAQDRMWQMDAMRRLAAGELSEVVGTAGVASDAEARRLRLPQLAEAQEKKLTGEAREVFAAYARGVNYFLETHRATLPLEFTVLRYEPRPWRPLDTILIGLQMTRTLTTSWQEELRKLHMLAKGDAEKVSYLYPARLATEAAPGSNAWVVSGAHTVSGKPLLANDPHLEFSSPSTWYMVHLKAGDLDVTGATLPGVPTVIIGHNQHIAWGMTNLEFDMQDLYRERIDGQTGRYPYRGQVEQARIERNVVPVKGQKSVDVVTLGTRHGPLFVTDQNQGYSLQTLVAGSTGDVDFAFLALNRAKNWDEFNAALARFPGPPQNFVYADDAGNIGYHVAGQVPVRPAECHGDVPSDGLTGACDWVGVIPYADLPQVFNPESGVIVSANQNPFPADYKYPVAGVFAPPYRAKQIRDRLTSKAKWTAEQMVGIQKDVYSSFLHFLGREVVKAWDKKPARNEASTAAVDALRKWDGQMEKGQAAPLVAALMYAELRKALAERASAGSGNEYAARAASPVIERLLRERPTGWFPDYDDLLVNTLAKALAEGERIQGSNVSRWDYGQFIAIRIDHPVFGALPFIGSYFNAGPVAMSGASSTVKQVSGKLGPSYRMVVDFADLDHSLANITLGESGHFLSPHYRDQFEGYYNGVSFPMQFRKVAAEDTLVVKASR